jgi:hypothetical protein
MHFTPTSAPRSKQAERFFGPITNECISPCSFSVGQVEYATVDCLDHYNAKPKPFISIKSPSAILEKVALAKQVLDSRR